MEMSTKTTVQFKTEFLRYGLLYEKYVNFSFTGYEK